jgi:deoxyribonuclease-4
MGNPQLEKREKAYNAFLEELQRCEQLDIGALNMHPGSHVREATEEECLGFIAENINRALDKTRNVQVALEITAGQGSNVGYTLHHLATLIDKTEQKQRIGICIDTCHSFAAGYDLRTTANWKDFLSQIETLIGLDKLIGMHVNDSKFDLGSRKDRHESLGKGYLGIDAFKGMMQQNELRGIPIILETPDDSIWAEEISLLRSFA